MEDQNPQAPIAKTMGADPIDLVQANKVPLIISSDFGKSDNNPANDIGKPVKPPTTTGDITLPTVTITSPANGATVTGTVNIAVSASDNVGVTSVSVSINSVLLATKPLLHIIFHG